MSKTTLEQLSEWNPVFESSHGAYDDYDLYKVNNYIELIEESRNPYHPMIGDVVRYTNKYGEYFSHAIVEWTEDGSVGLCEQGNPSIHKSNNMLGFDLSISGGSFPTVLLSDMKLVDATETSFWDFGHSGACADGAVYFYATVNVWECNVNEQKYSEKERDRYYVSYCKGDHPSGYHYFASKGAISSHAWVTLEEFQYWLRTMRADITQGYNHNIVVWTYKEKQVHVSPMEYEKIEAEEDVMLMNGRRKCKRIYDDENSIVYVYYVWYWKDDSMGDFYESSAKQNEIRKQYEVHWSTPINQIARKEFEEGKVKPYKVTELFRKWYEEE